MRKILGDILELFNGLGAVYGSGTASGLADCSSSMVGLSTGQSVYLKMLDDELGLVVLIRESHHDRIHLLNRNIETFWTALKRIA
jgi:hypothetical protein